MRVVLIFFLFCFSLPGLGQMYMNIHAKNGSVIRILISDIDSVTHLVSNTVMRIHQKNGSLLQLPLSEIDSVSHSDRSFVETTITGIVIDENGKLLKGVTLRIGNREVQTDQDGSFLLEKLEVPASRFYVSAHLSGYLPSGYGGVPVRDGITPLVIRLMSMGTPLVINGMTGGMVDVAGVRLTFGVNSFVRIDGTSYNGPVNVYARTLLTDLNVFPELIPGGDLFSLRVDGSPSMLESYGMVGVVLRDNMNNELKLASGKEAELRFPIASSQLITAPAEIPLLSLDEGLGIWKKEGVAVRTSNEYIGKVGHFSWWNLDVQRENVRIKGKVIDCNGRSMSGVSVIVNKQFSLITDVNGEYEAMAPRIPLSFEVKLLGTSQVLSNTVTLANPATGLNILPDLRVGNCPTYITGTIEPCGRSGKFYVRAIWGNNNQEGWLPQLIQGDTFRITVPPGMPLIIRLSSGTLIRDTLITLVSNGQTLNIGQLSGCMTKPFVRTLPAGSISQTTASSGGEIIGNGGSPITARGVCWSTASNPTINNNKTSDSTGVGRFISTLQGLASGSVYFVRAYATNSLGTSYGEQVSVTAGLDPSIFNTGISYGSLVDIEGNVYRTVQIGTQTWMAENLRTATYRNGEQIQIISDSASWANNNTNIPAWSFYQNNASGNIPYGKLYNWYAVTSSKGICPLGWHIPKDEEWNQLTNVVGFSAGGKLKSAGTSFWTSPNTGGTNAFGFSALPAGGRGENANFSGIFTNTYFWSATVGANPSLGSLRLLEFNSSSIPFANSNRKSGYSVRCVKD